MKTFKLTCNADLNRIHETVRSTAELAMSSIRKSHTGKASADAVALLAGRFDSAAHLVNAFDSSFRSLIPASLVGSALMGSTNDARRAGMMIAASPTPENAAAAVR